MIDQRPTTPILRDVAKHAMLNLISFACAGRKVADMNRYPQTGGQVLQRHLPHAAATSTAASPSAVINRPRA
jgi:hypothetical protein